MLSAQGLLFGAALAFLGAIMRTRVYVDGVHLYYGSLKDTPLKWLNLIELAHNVLPPSPPLLRAQQRLYFKAM